eukprot:6168444-Ditylum_brightwellii.AAC.2
MRDSSQAYELISESWLKKVETSCRFVVLDAPKCSIRSLWCMCANCEGGCCKVRWAISRVGQYDVCMEYGHPLHGHALAYLAITVMLGLLSLQAPC